MGPDCDPLRTGTGSTEEDWVVISTYELYPSQIYAVEGYTTRSKVALWAGP